MHHETSYDAWIGRDAYDNAGEKIGEITDVYYDDSTGRPEWIAVKTGLFGSKETFVPIHGSQLHHDPDRDDENDTLRLAFDKSMVKEAPNIDPEGHLSPAEEQELWTYWGYDYASQGAQGYGQRYGAGRADQDFQFAAPTSQRRQTGAIGNVGTERGSVEAEATIHNQEAQVVTTPETVRLRKIQRTEMVPVTKEEVVVERDGKPEDVRTQTERIKNR